MLAYILALAIAVAIGSLTFYLMAFVKPSLHRKDDFLWSGVGLFYALVLWICAERITGAVLLGQTASVLLLSWLIWQVVLYRKAIAFPERQAEILSFSILDWIETKIKPKKPPVSPTKTEVTSQETPTENIEKESKIKEQIITPVTETAATSELKEEVNLTETTPEIKETQEEVIEEIEEIEEITTISESVQTEQPKTEKKGFSLGKLIGQVSSPFTKKKSSQPAKETVKSESLSQTLKDDEIEDIEDIFEEENTETITTTIDNISEVKEEEKSKETPEVTDSEILASVKAEEKPQESEAQEEIVITSEETTEKKSESEDDNPFKELTS